MALWDKLSHGKGCFESIRSRCLNHTEKFCPISECYDFSFFLHVWASVSVNVVDILWCRNRQISRSWMKNWLNQGIVIVGRTVLHQQCHQWVQKSNALERFRAGCGMVAGVVGYGDVFGTFQKCKKITSLDLGIYIAHLHFCCGGLRGGWKNHHRFFRQLRPMKFG